jgi:hypothetical protein
MTFISATFKQEIDRLLLMTQLEVLLFTMRLRTLEHLKIRENMRRIKDKLA